MTIKQAEQLKQGDKVTVWFTESVDFRGGPHFEKGQKLTDRVSGKTNVWLGIGGLMIPYHLIEIKDLEVNE